jgi:hypothetical protein
MIRPPSYSILMNLPKREELSLRTVFALPKASRKGLQSSTFFSTRTVAAAAGEPEPSRARSAAEGDAAPPAATGVIGASWRCSAGGAFGSAAAVKARSGEPGGAPAAGASASAAAAAAAAARFSARSQKRSESVAS